MLCITGDEAILDAGKRRIIRSWLSAFMHRACIDYPLSIRRGDGWNRF